MILKILCPCVCFQKSAYSRDFEETKYMSSLTKDNELLVSKVMKKGFDSEPLYNDKYSKTLKKSCGEKLIQVFMMKKYQKKVLIVFVYQLH